MTNLEVTDDFLSPEDFEILNGTTKPGENFPWVCHLNNVNNTGFDTHLQNMQHSHVFYLRGEWMSGCSSVLDPVIQKLNAFVLIRVKANLLLYSGPEPFFGGFHTDTYREDICRTGILYLDTCNGSTEFEGGEKVDAVANRFVQFPANVRHGSWGATDVPYRRVINFNWIPM